MAESTGRRKRSRWFWVGVTLLSASVIVGIVTWGPHQDPVDFLVGLAGKIILTAPLWGVGIYGVLRGRNAPGAVAVSGKGAEAISPEVIQRAMDTMKETEQPRVLASYKVGFRKKLELTDKGIRTKKLSIPYALIQECNCYRDSQLVPNRCGVKYIGESGFYRHVVFGGHGLEIYRDILRISGQHGYKISQSPHVKLFGWARRLEGLNIESEFVEPDFAYNRKSGSSWMIDLGGFKLRGTHIDTVSVEERGKIIESGYGQYSSRKIDIQYLFTYGIQIDPIPNILCHGRPEKRFPRRVVDYHWEGSKLAENLNKDTELRKRLRKAKAPSMKLEGNHVQMQDKRFPSLKLFHCVEMIVGHVLEEAKW